MSRRSISFAEYVIASAIRAFLMHNAFQSAFQERVEISTPLNSWKRLQEGIYLHETGVDPYTGDMFHESPVMLLLFKWLIQIGGDYLYTIFIAADMATAYLLFIAAERYVQTLKEEDDSLRKNFKKTPNIKISAIDVQDTPLLVAYAYLFNPYIIFNCVAQTTTVVFNLSLAIVLYSLVTRRRYICTLFLAFGTLQSPYTLLLLVPVCLQLYQQEKTSVSVIKTILSFFTFIGSLLSVCFYVSGSLRFVNSIYLFIFNVHDLTPNVGLFWYFFTEMFEHFRSLFIAALQINATVLYLIPLSLHLRNDPIFLTMVLMALTAVFKSYPSLGDVGFYLALLPLWNHLFLFMHQLFIVGCILIITSVLGPTVWHLWIYSGSANANFFFGVTLAFATAQIFLVTDLLFARKKRQFAIKYGWPEDTQKRVLILD